ncbi:pantetheine-phosphate adenylyltransferase [Bacteroidetes/Chlorobi group bacterium Naka2016]|nr:MAG: pantetheine-phosphate adenylyltransferase [Bacteroidetes/Chlorobi group bacterium Naka2016]
MANIAIYPGTFDPITNGHIDVIERASVLFDKIIVVIARNPRKQTLFSEEERLEMIRESLKHLNNIEVKATDKLTVEFASRVSAKAIIRGIRAVSDFEYEFQIALMNRKLCPDVTTIFLMPNEKYTYLNSSIIRELARYGANVDEFVPPYVAKKLKEKFTI